MGWIREARTFAANTLGNLIFAVRRDTPGPGTGVDDGEIGALSMNSAGALYVTAASGSSGTATDDAAFTPASGTGTVIFGFADETTPDSVNEGDAGAVRMTLTRALHTNLRDSSGNELGIAAAPVVVGGTAAHDAAISGSPSVIAGVASAAAPSAVSADQDVVRLWALRSGALATQVTAAGALVGGDATNGLDVDVTRVATPSTIYHGQTTVTTAGTEVTLGSSQALTQGAWIKALHANTGMIYVGANPVTSSTGFVLDAGESIFVPVDNRTTIFVDSSVNGEGVSYVAF
jgi:hypothetical protein